MKKAKSILALLLALIISVSGSVFAFAAQTAEEDAENSTPSTADVVGVGSSISAKLDTPTDVDWFVFDAKDCGLATVTLSHNALEGADESASFFKVEVIGEDGVFIESFKSAGGQKDASVSFSVTPADYYISVQMDRQHLETLTYTVSVKLDKSALVEKENNNTYGDATPLTMANKTKPDTLYYGTIDKGSEASGDVDYFKITVPADYLLYPSIYNTASNTGNYSLSIVETIDGDGGVTVERSLGTLKIAENEAQKDGSAIGVKAGTYYIKVAGIEGSVGGYQIRIYGGSASKIETEYNNTSATADIIYVGSEITGSLFDANDVDCFEYTTKGKNGGYKITLSAYSKKVTNGQWSLVMRNESDGQVCKLDATVNEAGVAETDALPAGTYTIYVTKGNNFTDDIYTLKFEAKEVKDEPEEEEPANLIEQMMSFFKKIGDLNWGKFADQFMEWLPSVNVFGMIQDIMNSVIPFLTEFLFKNT